MNNYGMVPPYQSPIRPSYYPQTQVTNNISWVRGVSEAENYQILPNSNVLLMDSENEGRFYIKTRDTMGLSQLRIFAYEEITNKPAEVEIPQIDLSNYVTREELQKMLETVKEDRHEQSVQSTKSKSKSHTE